MLSRIMRIVSPTHSMNGVYSICIFTLPLWIILAYPFFVVHRFCLSMTVAITWALGGEGRIEVEGDE
jgi:hypothetical protein